MLDMENMVTIEVLRKSQPTRPRKWIPVVCFIMFVITALCAGFQALYILGGTDFAKKILAKLPNLVFVFGGKYQRTFAEVTGFCFSPALLLVVNLVSLFIIKKICGFRKNYWILGWLLFLSFFVFLLLTIFMDLYYMVPFLGQFYDKIPANVMKILVTVFYYGTPIYSALFALFYFICIFYNVNYPAKYERIYELRKRRIKAYTDLDQRSAYKKRFYEDYRIGNFEEMLYELHSPEIETLSNEPMSRDAYDAMLHHSSYCNSVRQEALFNQYASEGRYYECRRMFKELKDVSDNLERGATIEIPHYSEQPRQAASAPLQVPPRRPAAPAPEPPLRPQAPRRNPNSKSWGPDDI